MNDVARLAVTGETQLRKQVLDKVEAGRVREGKMGSDASYGMNGAFRLNYKGTKLIVIVSDGLDPKAEAWEHVSVSTASRTPTWEEMSYIKDLFFEEEETVIEFHPPRSQYVNYHPHCLHLWRHREREVVLPPSILVGPKK